MSDENDWARADMDPDDPGSQGHTPEPVPRRVEDSDGLRVRHNHRTRDFKEPGKCPACDAYYRSVKAT